MIDTAVILAAGMGTRLGADSGRYPKGFLRFGTRPIIEESVGFLIDAGIRDIVIVTGFGATHYEEFAATQDGIVRTVHNPDYAVSGSMYSLYCARNVIDRGFLLLESDIIYEPRALTVVLSDPADDAVLLSGPTGAGDEVHVLVAGTAPGTLVDMSKNPQTLAGTPRGELVGVSKISAELFSIMKRIATSAFEHSMRFDYETDCLVAAARERPVACPLVSDLVWAEIDNPAHLVRARDDIYPEIRRRIAASEASS